MSTTWPILACIDIGSNGIRFVASEARPEGLKAVVQERAPVRLGRSVFVEGAIDPATLEAAIAALGSFRASLDALAQARNMPRSQVRLRAVATSAVRDARNRRTFLRRAQAAGVEVEVISGEEEARLVQLAVAQKLPAIPLAAGPGAPWLLVDVGGGSVEVSLAGPDGIAWTESRPLGAVRLLEQLREPEGTRKLRRRLDDAIATLRLPNLPITGIAGVVATGGNVEELAALAKTHAREPGKDGIDSIPVSGLAALLEEMAEMPPEERMRRWGLKRDRADVIVPAGYVYLHVARLAGAAAILVPHVALKDGVLADLASDAAAEGLDARARPPPRSTVLERRVARSALALGRRFHFEEAHGVQVERLAVGLFDQLSPAMQWSLRDRLVLSAAALLHDVGRHIADRRHHKHSHYLISQSEVAGLTSAEVRLAALVARYHRKAEPRAAHGAFAELSPPDQARVEQLSALLRVADALDRAHRSRVRTLTCRHEAGTTLLELGVQGHAEEERQAVARKGGLFERVFATRLQVREVA